MAKKKLVLSKYRNGELGNAYVISRPYKQIAYLIPDGADDTTVFLTRKTHIENIRGTPEQIMTHGDIDDLIVDVNLYLGKIELHPVDITQFMFGYTSCDGRQIANDSPIGKVLKQIIKEEPDFATRFNIVDDGFKINVPLIENGLIADPNATNKHYLPKTGSELKTINMKAFMYVGV